MRKFMTKCASALVAVTMLAQSTGLGGTAVFAAENGVEDGSNAVNHLIINQVYGGGRKGDTPISNSFVEIYNPTSEDISVVASDEKISGIHNDSADLKMDLIARWKE